MTSAEAVLINQQSYSKLLEAVMEGKVVVVAISPQSLASLADLLRIGINEAFLRLAAVLKAAGVRYVTDLACAGDVALTESVREFLMR